MSLRHPVSSQLKIHATLSGSVTACTREIREAEVNPTRKPCSNTSRAKAPARRLLHSASCESGGSAGPSRVYEATWRRPRARRRAELNLCSRVGWAWGGGVRFCSSGSHRELSGANSIPGEECARSLLRGASASTLTRDGAVGATRVWRE